MKLLFISLLAIGITLFSEQEYDLVKPAIKKMEKTLSVFFPDKILTKQPIVLTSEEQLKLNFELKNKEVFLLKSEGKLLGYMYLSKSKSKFDVFDYMVIFKPDLSILTVKVLLYREDYGGEISSKRWLRQFDGLLPSETARLDDDIQSISGATISCRAITKGINQLSINIKALNENQFLTLK